MPLIAIEDKKPFSGKLADEKCVLGQLFDYAVAMKAFGHATPFLILTTFEKSSMLWLKESDSNDIANNVESKLEKVLGRECPLGFQLLVQQPRRHRHRQT
jgi:hypothetical protein